MTSQGDSSHHKIKLENLKVDDGNKISKDVSSRKDKDANGNINTTKPSPTPKYRGLLSKRVCALIFPHFAQVATKIAIFSVVSLYVLNQNHMLPKPISAFVSKSLFWPTLPITLSRRVGRWTTSIDETVVIGGAPFGWLNVPKRLYYDHGIRGVVNLCEEYQGPLKQYEKLGIKELRLPTTDHFEPSVESLTKAVEFINKYENECLGRVYVHCRAGHGRSAAVVFAWLMSKTSDIDALDLEALNAQLLELRDVRKTLYKQENINKFRTWLQLNRKRD